MAYGGSELDKAAANTDLWIEDNALDLLSSHTPLVAQLEDTSKEPGGELSFLKVSGAEGNTFKTSFFARRNTTADGVTRANQATAIYGAGTVLGGSTATIVSNFKWEWCHYQGGCRINYSDEVRNSGGAGKINLKKAILDQLEASFLIVLATDLWDGVTGTEDKLQSVNHILAATSGTVGDVDVGDADNSPYAQAKRDTTTETFNWTTFDNIMLQASNDTGRATGIRKHEPDCAFMPTALYAKGLADLKVAGRVEVSRMLKGGAKYIMYAGGDMRIFREPYMTAGTVAIMNSSTWTFRYKTLMPEWVTPGFVPHPDMPSISVRNANWWLGLGCRAMFYNGYLANKTG